MSPLLASLSPDAAVLLLTLGVALIALELNRPGSILPGAAGLLIALLSLAAILRRHPSPLALALLLAAAAVPLLQLRRHIPAWIIVASIAAGVAALTMLPGVGLAVALASGLLLGAGTSYLTRIAHRARVNKGLD